MRPINNVVDVSNYVMLELGQPNHTYDLGQARRRRLPGPPGRDGETIVTLDGVERTLTGRRPADLRRRRRADRHRRGHGRRVDARSPTPRPTSLLEMAWFEPIGDRRTAAPARPAQRGVGPLRAGRRPRRSSTLAVARFVELLRRPARRSPSHAGAVDARGDLPDRAAGARCAPAGSTRCSAPTSPPTTSRALLDPIGFDVDAGDGGDAATSTVPSWRPDCDDRDRRHRGGRPPPTATSASARPCRRRPHAGAAHRRASTTGALLRQVLLGLGLDEAMPQPVPRARRPRPGRARPTRHHASPTRSSPRSRVLRTVAAARAAQGRRLQRVAPQRPASRCSRSATSTGCRRRASRCPTSARCSRSRSPGARRRRRVRGAGDDVADALGWRRRRRSQRRAGPACTPPAASLLGEAASARRGRRGRPRRARRLRHRRAGGVARARPRPPARPAARPSAGTGRSAGSRRATSTWRSWSPRRPGRRRRANVARCRRRRCSSTSRSSTCTAGRRSGRRQPQPGLRLRLQAADRTLTDAEVAEVAHAVASTASRQRTTPSSADEPDFVRLRVDSSARITIAPLRPASKTRPKTKEWRSDAGE